LTAAEAIIGQTNRAATAAKIRIFMNALLEKGRRE
jgi:hypothetical protein